MILLPLILLSQQYYSVPPVDAPELAPWGKHEIGVRTIELTTSQTPARKLPVEVWYPAAIPSGFEPHTTYSSAMVGRAPRPNLPATFSFPGRALRNAPPSTEQTFPLVIVSHGYPGSRTFMTWITENIASKGYIVAAIDHTDSVFGAVGPFQSTLANRAPDQLFVLKSLTGSQIIPQIDATRAAIIGYSMGGYGALASGGAAYNRNSPLLKSLNLPELTTPDNLKAIVAIAPWGAQAPAEAWTADSARGLKLPSLFIVGDQDDVSGFEQGVKKVYNWSTSSDRCLLVYQNARHNTGGNPAPSGVTLDFQAKESFEEPVWRKDRIIAINQHFITAFLDRHLKQDATRAKYFTPEANSQLPGFQRRWQLGLQLSCAPPQ